MSRVVLGSVLVVALGTAALLLRSQVMTRQSATPPGSSTVVSFVVETNDSPSDLRTVARALVGPCVADVDAEVIRPLRRVSPSGFRLVLRPALDADSHRKFRGCLADIHIPHALARQVDLHDRGVPDA